MIKSLSIAIGGIISLMLAWIFIQFLWKKTFAAYVSDEDALADRSTCANCTCATVCENKARSLAQ